MVTSPAPRAGRPTTSATVCSAGSRQVSPLNPPIAPWPSTETPNHSQTVTGMVLEAARSTGQAAEQAEERFGPLRRPTREREGLQSRPGKSASATRNALESTSSPALNECSSTTQRVRTRGTCPAQSPYCVAPEEPPPPASTCRSKSLALHSRFVLKIGGPRRLNCSQMAHTHDFVHVTTGSFRYPNPRGSGAGRSAEPSSRRHLVTVYPVRVVSPGRGRFARRSWRLRKLLFCETSTGGFDWYLAPPREEGCPCLAKSSRRRVPYIGVF